jgi:hypothetical protein
MVDEPIPGRTVFGLGKEFEEWIKATFGTSRSPLDTLNNDDDWTFVLKMHAYVEAALNHLIVTRLNNPKMGDVVAKMRTANSESGKLALIKAYDLLPDKMCLFVEILCSIRNKAVHNISGQDLDLARYAQSIKPEQRKAWRTAMTSCVIGEVTEKQRDDAISWPRNAIFCCGIAVIARAHMIELDSTPERFFHYWKSREKPYLPTPKEW